MPITKQEFIKSIRTKYPSYASAGDDELYGAIIKKYPQYESQISDTPSAQQQVQQLGQQSTVKPTATSYLGAVEKQPQKIPIVEKKPKADMMSLKSFYETGIKPAAQDLGGTVGGIVKKTYAAAKGGVERIGEAGVGLAEGKYTMPEAFARGAAGAIQTATSPLTGVVGQGIETVGKPVAEIIPQGFKDYIAKKTKPKVEDVVEWYNTQSPEQQKQLQNIGVGLELLASFIGAGAADKQIAKKVTAQVKKEFPKEVIKKPGIIGKTIQEVKKIPGRIEEGAKKVEARISGPQEIKFIPGKKETIVPQMTVSAKKIAKEELKANKTAFDILKPEKLTPTQIKELKIGGKLKTGKGITGEKWEYIPDKKDLEIAKDSSAYLVKGKSTSENIQNLKKGIGELGEKTKQEIINKGDGIFNNKTINSRLSNIDRPVLIKSDTSLNNAYNNVIKKAKDLIDKSPKKRSELLKVRKDFDNFVSREFPNLYTSDTLTPMKTAIMDVRATLNDFIAEGLPQGNKFRELLKQQSNMYRAIDMLGPKSDISKFGKLIKTPAFRYGTSAAAGGAIGTTIF